MKRDEIRNMIIEELISVIAKISYFVFMGILLMAIGFLIGISV